VEKRKLGNTSLEFAPIAFGGNVFGWTADEATSHRLLDAFVDAGFSFVDTADVYSRWYPGNKGGESEAIIGTWLKKNPAKRDKVQIATKCGMVPAEGALKRGHIKWSVDESLKRLNTDRIDLFQSHKDDKTTPIEETLSTYGELVKAGKLRFVGAPTTRRRGSPRRPRSPRRRACRATRACSRTTIWWSAACSRVTSRTSA
jgi:aryl-alcohol dehydrogenase-like predicted oxidoreductase